MKVLAVITAALLAVTLFSTLFLIWPLQTSSNQQHTSTVVEVRYTTRTSTTTLTTVKTMWENMDLISTVLLETLYKFFPNYESMEIYHVWLPPKPGTYLYSFAVFWSYGKNHSHVIFFHPPKGGKLVFMPGSLIQTRFAAAKNIPNVPAPWPPDAVIKETVITEDGQVLTKSWNVTKNLPGYPSQPQVERNGAQVWVVAYTPLGVGDYGESLVARYYFLEIKVIF